MDQKQRVSVSPPVHDEMLSIGEAAKMLNVSEQTLRNNQERWFFGQTLVTEGGHRRFSKRGVLSHKNRMLRASRRSSAEKHWQATFYLQLHGREITISHEAGAVSETLVKDFDIDKLSREERALNIHITTKSADRLFDYERKMHTAEEKYIESGLRPQHYIRTEKMSHGGPCGNYIELEITLIAHSSEELKRNIPDAIRFGLQHLHKYEPVQVTEYLKPNGKRFHPNEIDCRYDERTYDFLG